MMRQRDDYGQLGPAMKALPNDRWRAFVEFYIAQTFTNKNRENYGAQAAAARQAGFGKPNSTARVLAHLGWSICATKE